MPRGLSDRFLFHVLDCSCWVFMSLASLVHLHQALQILLNAVYFPRDFLQIHFIVIYSGIMIDNLVRSVTNYINKVVYLFSCLSIVHNSYGHHFIQMPNVHLKIYKNIIFLYVAHFLGLVKILTKTVAVKA